MSRLSVDSLVARARGNAAERPDDLAVRFLDVPEADWDFARLDREARAVAAWLQEHGAVGERALVLLPQGPEFLAAFFGCLYAGVVAVPCYPVPHPKQAGRVLAIARDAGAGLVLTDRSTQAMFAAQAAAFPEVAGAVTLDMGERDLKWAGGWRDPGLAAESLAFLQYTSGSTGAPKGVIVSHANLMANHAMMATAFGHDTESRFVSWLPLFHDMGLIGQVLQAAYHGAALALMAPATFIRRPARWLRAISDFRATMSGGPNFAFDLCVAKTTPEEREGLDLSCWRTAFNGAEPIQASTLERFVATFAPYGLDPDALYPCYGLAEATLFVAGTGARVGPTVREYAPRALEAHVATPARPGEPAQRLVASGEVAWPGQTVRIVDPERLEALPTGRVGEIWVAGSHVAEGYWGRPASSAEVFGSSTTAGEGPFLRTGDLGFLDADGRLSVCGRLKDLIIVRGRNLAPQDLELAAAEADVRLRGHATVAFAVDGPDGEALVVVAETTAASIDAAGVDAASARVRRALTLQHGVALAELVLIAPGTMPKTSSGKLQRQRCRQLYLTGSLARVDVVERAAA